MLRKVHMHVTFGVDNLHGSCCLCAVASTQSMEILYVTGATCQYPLHVCRSAPHPGGGSSRQRPAYIGQQGSHRSLVKVQGGAEWRQASQEARSAASTGQWCKDRAPEKPKSPASTGSGIGLEVVHLERPSRLPSLQRSPPPSSAPPAHPCPCGMPTLPWLPLDKGLTAQPSRCHYTDLAAP